MSFVLDVIFFRAIPTYYHTPWYRVCSGCHCSDELQNSQELEGCIIDTCMSESSVNSAYDPGLQEQDKQMHALQDKKVQALELKQLS